MFYDIRAVPFSILDSFTLCAATIALPVHVIVFPALRFLYVICSFLGDLYISRHSVRLLVSPSSLSITLKPLCILQHGYPDLKMSPRVLSQLHLRELSIPVDGEDFRLRCISRHLARRTSRLALGFEAAVVSCIGILVVEVLSSFGTAKACGSIGVTSFLVMGHWQ